ncbi:DNA primase [Aestuariivirga sp.]|uniref:DNA primase n=1 Tax=Aestuariivirga sp. TaxID=2650926 RepID=UPI0039E4934E
MRFPPTFLDQIRARVNISSVIGRHVTWDRRKTQAAKGDYWACCPFHGEKSPSFHADDRKGRYHCFGCKASGDIFTFLVEKEGLSFPEAVERLAGDAGLPMPVVSEADVERDRVRASLYDVMEIAAKLFQAELQTSHGAKARGYLADRDLSPAVQKEFGIGYSRDDRAWLRNELAAKGVGLDQMVEAGLVIANEDNAVGYDRFRDRVMFPIRDQRGRVIAFGGRALRPDVPAKYLNSPETPIFHKGDVLYNFDKARGPAHTSNRLIAVEGYVDVIAMHRAGFGEAVAPLGTALTENQLGLLWRTVPEPILCFDGDGAGLKAAYRALDLALPLLSPGHSLRFAFLPEGKDPDDLLRAEGPDAVRAVIAAAAPLADVLWRRALAENDRSSPERKAAFERDIKGQLNGIKDEMVRRHYLDDLHTRLRELWGQGRPQGAGPGAARGGAPRGFQPRLKPGQKAWEVPMPASPQLRAAAGAATTAAAAERRERMILLSAINHPEVLHDFWEDFAGLDFTARVLDSLRTLILDVASSEEALDRAALKAHLIAKGYGPDLDRLEDQAKRLNEWFLGPLAAPDDARTGLRQMIALHRKTVTLDRELKAAEAAFAREPSEANLATLIAVRDQLSSATGAEALIEGFGAASGRTAGEAM